MRALMAASSQHGEFIGIDIVALALGEAEQKHHPRRRPIGEQCAEPAATSLSGPPNTLLDQAGTEIGVDETALGSVDGFAQRLVAQSLPPLKPGKSLHHENPHPIPRFELV